MNVSSDSVLAAWKYVELAAFKTWVDKETGEIVKRVVREQTGKSDNRKPVIVAWNEVDSYRKKYNNTGVYTSVFRYDNDDVENTTRLGNLYFDFDSESEPALAHKDAKNLFSYLSGFLPKEIIRVYFTGLKGFHLEVEAIALGVSPGNNLHNIFRFMAEDLIKKLSLTTLDLAVYDPRRIWRLPNSIHQKSGLYKIELLNKEIFSSINNITDLAQSLRETEEPAIKFNALANEWYKQYIVGYEQHLQLKHEEYISYKTEAFNKYGTSIIGGHSAKYIKLAWQNAIKAIENTEPGKNRNDTLSKQAFRIYLLLLENNIPLDDARSTLQNLGIGIGLDVREVQATLNSAEKGARKRIQEA